MTFREITHDVLGLTSVSLKPMLDNGKDTGILFAMFVKSNSKLVVYVDAHVIHCMDAATRNDLQYEDKTHNGVRAVYITGLKTVVEKPQPQPQPKNGQKEWNAFFGEDVIEKEPTNAQFRRYAADAFPKQRYKF